MTKKEINTYAKQLKTGELQRRDISREILNSEEFKTAERKAKIRIPSGRGFDIINNHFFVEEIVRTNDSEFDGGIITFYSFDDYYSFLSGNIYDNSCYYGYLFDSNLVSKYNLNINRLKNTHLISEKIDDSFEIADNNSEYEEIEKDKNLFYKWLNKFAACMNADEFDAVQNRYVKSKCRIKSMGLIYCLLIRNDADKAFSLLMDLVNHYKGRYYLLEELCLHYGTKKVLDAVDVKISNKSYRYKIKKKIINTCNNILDGDFVISYSKGFSKKTHFYYIKKHYISKENKFNYYTKSFYFDDFVFFANYLNGDLSNCDLSGAKLDIDFSKFITNKKTILPAGTTDFLYTVEKNCSGNNSFSINQYWTDNNGNILKNEYTEFYHFFDFLYFLNGDLSGIDFTMCEGIINLNDLSGLNLKGCKFRSDFMLKFGKKIKTIIIPKTQSFEFTQKNEDSTQLALETKNEITINTKIIHRYSRLSYISDLHLIHAIHNYGCKTREDISYVLTKYTDILHDSSRLLLGGDISSNFKYFEMFLDKIDSGFGKGYFFILGNHELWDFEGVSFNKIVKKYRRAIESHGHYLLQNSLVYETPDRKTHEIDESTLIRITADNLRQILRTAQLIILGGLAFSGCNEEFNANNGIYRNVLSRNEEKEQSKIFNNLYEKVCKACFDKNVVIFTHTPKPDWSGNNDYHDGFIYVNGHTHRNHFYDDGSVRIYADNQIGYKKKTPFLKHFYVGRETDYFADYKDGIYEITKDEYNTFYRCKSIGIDYNRDGNVIMLKRNGYYAFFKETKSGLCILYGGALKKVDMDINYYYENMLGAITRIKKPLDKYTNIQKKISSQIKAIGGSGYIHGCIIDIDFYNHIYVNPIDMTITGYFAYDIINKIVYKNVPSLLKDKCPSLYANYKKCLSSKAENALIIPGNTELDINPSYYLDTDIYSASREIRKMQKLNSGILTTWIEPETDTNLLEQNGSYSDD